MRRRLQIRGFGGCYALIHHFYKNNEPRRKKTGRRGLRPDLTQTGLYSYSIWLEAQNFSFRKYPCSETKGGYQLRGYLPRS